MPPQMHEYLALRALLKVFARKYKFPFQFSLLDYNLHITETEEALLIAARDCVSSLELCLQRDEINEIFCIMCHGNINNVSLLKQQFIETIRYWANQSDNMGGAQAKEQGSYDTYMRQPPPPPPCYPLRPNYAPVLPPYYSNPPRAPSIPPPPNPATNSQPVVLLMPRGSMQPGGPDPTAHFLPPINAVSKGDQR